MSRMAGLKTWTIILVGLVAAFPARAEVLTVDRAVEIALRRSSSVVNAEASVLDARSGLYGAYSGILPRLSADLTRGGQWTKNSTGNQAFGGNVFPPTTIERDESYFTTPEVTARWSVLGGR